VLFGFHRVGRPMMNSREEKIQNPYRIIEGMARIDLHFKVVVDINPEEKLEKLTEEIRRQIRKIYGVREVELSNYVKHSGD
jgi:hypothetical protein